MDYKEKGLGDGARREIRVTPQICTHWLGYVCSGCLSRVVLLPAALLRNSRENGCTLQLPKKLYKRPNAKVQVLSTGFGGWMSKNLPGEPKIWPGCESLS